MSVLSSFTQIGMGEWRMHISPYTGQEVASGNNAVYISLQSGLLEYDLEFGEKTLRTAADFLSDVSITALGHDPSSDVLAIGYENGNLDLLKGETIINLPAIVLSSVSGVKRINKIRSLNGEFYLATGFGIVVINIEKSEVKSTYYPPIGGEQVYDIAFLNDSIYALTENRIFSGALSNDFLADPNQWNELSYIPDYSSTGKYTSMIAFENDLFLVYDDDIYNSDTVFQLTNNNTSVIVDQIEINNLSVANNLLIFPTDGAAYFYNETLVEEFRVFSYQHGTFPSPNDAVFVDGHYYMADKNSGLVRFPESNPFGSEQIIFSGPRQENAFQAKWTNGKLSVASGGLIGNNPSFSQEGGRTLENETWQDFQPSQDNIIQGQNIWDYISTAINPANTNQIAFGTFSEIPLVLTDNGSFIVDTFSIHNSTIELTNSLTGWSYISDLIFENNNLWILNSSVNNPLKLMLEDGTFLEFNLSGQIANKRTRRIVVDQNGVKWFSVDGAGVAAFNDNGTPDDPSDDEFRLLTTSENNGNLPSSIVEGLAVDLDNNLWVGTEEGMRVLFNTSNIFDAAPGQYDFQRLLIEFGENVEIVLGSTHITSIAIDGANRKWIGTANSGVFLFSPDGLTLIENFRDDNSPLLSNTILDITINQENGEVFFVTAEGMISYRSNASQGDRNYSKVKVFPNPVQPNYFGPITIQGIAANSDVRITDVSGKLVFQTRSNGGTATWDGQTLDGRRATTGVYLIWTSIDVEGVKGREVGKVVFIN
jgi:hypothetical protein